jgi:hypothetical protein
MKFDKPKTYMVETICPPEVVRVFEEFYENADKDMERRFRDLVLEYFKGKEPKDPDHLHELMNDLYFLFITLDACQDAKELDG